MRIHDFLVRVGSCDPRAVFEIGVRRKDDGFAGAQTFDDQAMTVSCFGAKCNGSAFGGVVRRDHPDFAIADESFFGDVNGQSG